MKFTMSHHLVTVCVVCVLCAAHTPCSAHTDLSNFGEQHSKDIQISFDSNQRLQQPSPSSWTSTNSKDQSPHKKHFNAFGKSIREVKDRPMSIKSYSEMKALERAKGKENGVVPSPPAREEEVITYQKRKEIMERLGQLETKEEEEEEEKKIPLATKRAKRHVDDRYFMKKMFEKYGDGSSLTIEGFEKLLNKLGLLNVVHDASRSEESLQKGKFTNLSKNDPHRTEEKNPKEKCLNGKELLSGIAHDETYAKTHHNGSSTTVPDWVFERVCPILLYQLAGENSGERNGCLPIPEFHKPVNEYVTDEDTRNMVQVWIYSSISILIISLCGLLGVAVIPVMGKTYYNQLLQFLVALAVGTLCGDALIHLLPHAMMSSHHHSHESGRPTIVDHEADHNSNMWKGLTAMIGLVMFFFIEKALTMIAEWRKQRQRQNKLPSRVRVMRESDGSNTNDVGEKLCKHKYSSYPYCYGEITTETQDNHHHRPHNHHDKPPPVIEEEKPLTSNCNSVAKIMSNELDNNKKSNDDWRLEDSMMNNSKKIADIPETLPLKEMESYTVIIREHENKHHGHTHSHGHVHSAPESMSNVVWMVIMGDGIHNFTDGMAIGAAFAASIAGGFSTAIAVLCHELPHELGDFAVLLKAGMSAKQAVFYNLISSVLCLFGMIFGVLLGSTPTATSWMFAAAAGMFIYIALVDMIPELSSSHSADNNGGGGQWQCVFQGLGLSVGLGVMLLIALYEHDLKHIFNN